MTKFEKCLWIAKYLDGSIYPLERMQDVSVGSLSLHCSPENNPEEYYHGCFCILLATILRFYAKDIVVS